MVVKMLLILLAILPIATPAQAGWWDSVTSYFQKAPPQTPPKIKVLVVHDQPGVVLEVKGKYKIVDPYSGEHISTRFIGKRKFIQAVRDGLKWGEEFPGTHQLMIIPDEKETTTIVDGIEYHGPIFVYDVDGTISVVNQVYVEDYLYSILSQRYRHIQSPETLAAIAIAARTMAYYRVDNPKSQYWSIDGRQVDYQGYAAATKSSPMEKAIYDTRYMIMSLAPTKEELVRTFPAEWKQEKGANVPTQVAVSHISLAEAEAMGNRGENAAQILVKAFPGSKIELMRYSLEPAAKESYR